MLTIGVLSVSFGFTNVDDNTIFTVGDKNQTKKDVVNYFKSINNESSITVLPNDVMSLSYLTASDFNFDEAKNTNNDLSFITQNIYFNNNSFTIPKLGIDQLQSLGKFLIDNKNVKVTISCFTDSRGNYNYNKELSVKRGENIRLYLLSMGITGERIIMQAYGEENPVINCETVVCDDEKHAKNRRAELQIVWN